MNSNIRYIGLKLVAFAVSLALYGCMERMESPLLASDYVSFKASIGNSNPALPVKGISGSFDFEEQEWVLEDESGSTKSVTLYNSLHGLDAGVYGYLYSGEWSAECTPLNLMSGIPYKFDGDQMNALIPVKWSAVEAEVPSGTQFRIFAYAPKSAVVPVYQTPASGANSAKGAPVIKISDIFAKDASGNYLNQKDIVVADNKVSLDSKDQTHRKEINLDFQHIYTAIQFKAGFKCAITDISITNIAIGGDYIIGGAAWNNLIYGSYSMAGIPDGGLQVQNGDNIGEMVLVLPQTISSNEAQISLSYIADGETNTVVANLNGVEWNRGKMITYTLMREDDRQYIYMDLAAGEVKIEGKKYTGYVFVKQAGQDEPVALPIAGVNNNNKKYYIYQSCVTDVIKNDSKFSKNYKSHFTTYIDNGDSGKSAGGVFTKPAYDPVSVADGRLWSDYITNNPKVENVIEAWDNKAGAGERGGTANGTGAKGAVRNVGREATKNSITVSGDVDDCVMVLDNVYCSYNSDKVQNRKYGSVSFIPDKASGSNLTLHLVGDSRLGCIHYDNQTKNATDESANNHLIIQGDGSLTVADVDFYKGSTSGYYSNHYDSAIGNADDKNNTYGIIINSGTVYAGTTAAENCTAIGGGGNGAGEVTINGGVVTAVATTTGTAIGGGIGFSSEGGKGIVKITGGNVYAYNHKNSHLSGKGIPSSAIGGAGSNSSSGAEGTVIITGGNVYAESGLGTAIGGGSSATKHGGKGNITISGGYVIAKSKDPGSAGIGGGSSYTNSYSPSSGVANPPKNGGDAVINISGNSIIRTGSIGGGTPGLAEEKVGGKIGSAQITITGGDIQAQFVMANSDANEFNLSGTALIRNSATSNSEYYCIQPNGGAVYMERGTFTMSGGTIKGCKADKEGSKGGAVYIEGDGDTKFTMSGGAIEECMSATDGGAVYLKGGMVTLTGGTISGNVTYEGNGGAVCIYGGDFYLGQLSGETLIGEAKITQNAAFNKSNGVLGNGGGIYIAAEQLSSEAINVNLYKGRIESNSADRNGGGVCVDMGSNTTARLNVVMGKYTDEDTPRSANPTISGNNAQVSGGGMYVKGSGATVAINDGNLLDNGVSAYRVNPDITVEGGTVTLAKAGITTQVAVVFNNNAQYYDKNAAELTKTQYIVAASNNQVNAVTFNPLNAYYTTITGWNTRRDGKGTPYTIPDVYLLNEDITLYAQWNE